MKLSPKKTMMVVAAIVVVGVGAAAYLMLSGPEAYELSYSFQPGESYVYETEWTVEYLGVSVDFSLRETLNVLEVTDNEFGIRDSAIMQFAVPETVPQDATMVMTFRMTNKGVRSALEIETVEPTELWTSMEEARGQVERYLSAIYQYPADPVPIGREWSVPVDFEFEQAGISMTLTGRYRSSIAGRETITVGAGTFDCWHLVHRISASGEMVVLDQTVTVTMLGEGSSWIDFRSGAQTKVNLPLSIKAEAAGGDVEAPMTLTSELVEYQAP